VNGACPVTGVTGAPTARPTPASICFHLESSSVEVQGKGVVPLAELALGDKVAAVDALGDKIFSEVYSFSCALLFLMRPPPMRPGD